ncbi:MAG: S1C family serine protease, partial [Chloroflexota bacterium]
AYFATPNYLDLYGLPTSRVTDMGNHFAVRTQRTVIQEWKEDVPWAKAGQVTFANAGTIAAEVGLIPLWAMLPEETPGAGGPDLAPIDELDAASVDAVTAQVRRATVRVLAPPAGTGTGFIIDKRGYIVTANHVVEGATVYAAVLADGSVVSARLVGRDPVVDVAVLKIPGGELPVAPLGRLASLREGDPLIALGYGPPNTNQLSIRLGRAVSLASRAVGQGNGARLTFLLSTVPLVPGYSGGPIVDAQGKVIGMDSAVIVARGSPAAREGISIAIETVLKVAQDLIARQPAARALPLMSTNESLDAAAA